MGHASQRTGNFRPSTWSLAALCVCALLRAAEASAQVLEIGDDGEARKVGGGWSVEAPAAPRTSGPPAAFRAAIEAAAARYDLSPDFLDAVARSESGYDPDIVSPAGAIGVMQLMPATARQLGVDPWNPAQNIMGGAAYLRAQLDKFDGAVDLALAAYNAGSGRVVRYGGVPPFRETRAYVATNLDRLATASLKSTPIDGDLP
jgi:soluble lytic murein transglycosylase-like protein